MRLILLRSTCGDTRSCPSINATDRGTYVVQGYLVVDHAALAPDESVVEVPSSLLPELAGPDAVDDVIRRTGRGTFLIRGRTIVDAEALRELNLPPGEAAIEVPMSALPTLEVARAG
ncbi:MAG: hypothetical protein ACRDTA_02665 [Pseudonocardiaceae bacterium]